MATFSQQIWFKKRNFKTIYLVLKFLQFSNSTKILFIQMKGLQIIVTISFEKNERAFLRDEKGI